MGSKVIKVVLLKDNKILARSLVVRARDKKQPAEEALAEAINKAGISRDDIKHIVATGGGRELATFADDKLTLVNADARGVIWLFPSARTIIDVGAEEGWAVKCDNTGKVKDFVNNEKCSAGAGTFVESMARALELKLEDMGPMSLKSQKAVPINAQCAVFAESEVVSLVHTKTAKEDIVRAVHDAMAARIGALARQVGVEEDVVLIGGVARNVGFVDSLKKFLKVKLLIPDEPLFVSALGAALAASEAK